MRITVQPGSINGIVTAPASKSAMQRACAAALIKKGRTVLHNPGVSADDNAALDIIKQLGAKVERSGETIIIESKGVNPIASGINCGESGLSVRMFTSIAALSDTTISITGTGSLLKRPVSFFNEVLPKLQVDVKSNNGLLPMTIKGPLVPGNITVDGSLSSQFLTGLLMAFAAAGARDVTITVKDLNSKPYIDLTLKVMSDFGLHVPLNKQYEAFYFPTQSISTFQNNDINYNVEGDWSGGAFLLVAGAIAGNITVKGLDLLSTQADKAILQALHQAGVIMSIRDSEIEINKSNLKPFHFDATDCPDLFPPLVSLAAYCKGTSVIAGVHRLTHKESNRALTLQQEFGKLGIKITLQDDLMLIEGGSGVQAAATHSHHDHRIAMACAVAALEASGEVIIDDAEAVNKSYPQFYNHLSSLQATLK
ncbi:MAG TPA: 3-phosphoshikimate 1-carboxyvinyltransferase [Flavisolibacter sp.]|nr:3-phosphoshikimate 1-carboxyvinyltransferase [Flavisolibacter sp.]